MRPKSTFPRSGVEASKTEQAYINDKEKKYNDLVRNMSRESNSIGLVLQRIQIEKQYTEQMIAQKNSNIEGHRIQFAALERKNTEIIRRKQEKMEKECLELQENYRD